MFIREYYKASLEQVVNVEDVDDVWKHLFISCKRIDAKDPYEVLLYGLQVSVW